MKIEMSKSQWEIIGKTAGWMRKANTDCLKCKHCGSNNIVIEVSGGSMLDHAYGLCNDCHKQTESDVEIKIEQFPYDISAVINEKSYNSPSLEEYSMDEGNSTKEELSFYNKLMQDHETVIKNAKIIKVVKCYGYGDDFKLSGNPCDFCYEVWVSVLSGEQEESAMIFSVTKDGSYSSLAKN
jgi:hypothetical protein